jgi:hypothetical protein
MKKRRVDEETRKERENERQDEQNKTEQQHTDRQTDKQTEQSRGAETDTRIPTTTMPLIFCPTKG